MTSFATVPVELQVTGSRLAQLVEDVRAAAAPLRADAEELLGGTWHGGAATGFAAGWHEWLAGYGEILTALAEFAEQTSAGGRAYGSTDEQGRATFVAAGGAV